MNTGRKIYDITAAAALCAIGIIIPMFSPVKVVLEPASFTLASHVPVFIAMFISPYTSLFVALGTTAGFFFGGFPLSIVLRALTHCIFAVCGSIVLKKRPEILKSIYKALVFSFIISILHAICEVLAVTPLYFGNAMSPGFYNKGYTVSVILLVGVGTVVHSMVDFFISLFIWKPLSVIRSRTIRR